MALTRVTIEEVRCFAKVQHFDIRPLTFLVGENSTGKTSVMACIQILADFLQHGRVDFNQYPYSMGTFKDIVRRSQIREKAFRLGLKLRDGNEDIDCSVQFVQKEGGVEPVVKTATIRFRDGEVVFKTNDDMESPLMLSSYDERAMRFHLDVTSETLANVNIFTLLNIFSVSTRRGGSEGAELLAEFLSHKDISKKEIFKWNLLGEVSFFGTTPVRSRPKRTYDPTREYGDPEGSDVPMMLMRIAGTDHKEWEGLRQQLVEFGNRSGLFQNIDVKNLGPSMGAPFQLRIKVRGPTSNVVDVGYGISQVLPILVHIFSGHPMRRRNTRDGGLSYFLLQQPEVHLHPRAQAELSSVLANLASRSNQSFIVETHSDYMIDRARIEMRRGTISHHDVSLIYLEPKNNIVKVHNISFDKMGNMIGVPPHFRDFFLLETDRLMGFED